MWACARVRPLPGRLDWLRLSPENAVLPARVIIVDDAPVFGEVARELLERRGYTVVGEAENAASAIDAVARLRPDAVLVDIRLPDGDGFALSAALTRAHPELVVLLVSADREVPSAARVRASGARGFALKMRLAATDLEQFWPSP
jgi:two-component system, chemotaxis family, chemotaxis protein CheY